MLGKILPESLPERLRPERRPAARRRGRPAAVRRAGGRDRARHRRAPQPGGDRRGLPRTSPSTTWPTRSRRSRSQRGNDVSRYALLCFGGAGGQHACQVADALGIRRVIHPLAGVLSAFGMGLADQRALRERRSRGAGRRWRPTLVATGSSARRQARGSCWRQDVPEARIGLERARAPALRRHGQRARGALGTPDAMARLRVRAPARYGFIMRGQALVVEAVSVEAHRRHATAGRGAGAAARPREAPPSRAIPRLFDASRTADWRGTRRRTPARGPAARRRLVGPGASSREANATIVVEPGWRAAVDARATT